MQFFSVSLFGVRAVAVLPFLLMGCTITHTIQSSDIPSLQIGSPLRSIKPKTFAFKEFRDIRGSDPLWAGTVMNHEYKLEKPVTLAVGTAIRKELERNGHICIDYSEQAKADFIIEGVVVKYYLHLEPGVSIVIPPRVFAFVVVKLTVSNTYPDRGILSKVYEGNGQARGIAPAIGTPLVSLSQAQMAMLKEMSTDIELIAFLEK